MHALIVEAIQQANLAGVDRLSLAAMPLKNPPWPLSLLSKNPSTTGLRKFKTSFAPHKKTLYAAARTRIGMFLGGTDILLRILYPDTPADDQLSGTDFWPQNANFLPENGLPFTRFAIQTRN